MLTSVSKNAHHEILVNFYDLSPHLQQFLFKSTRFTNLYLASAHFLTFTGVAHFRAFQVISAVVDFCSNRWGLRLAGNSTFIFLYH